MSYKTEPVTVDDLVVTVTSTGTLQPTNEVDVGSELSGNIEEVLVDFNDQVTVGQVLARMDVSKLRSPGQADPGIFADGKGQGGSGASNHQRNSG